METKNSSPQTGKTQPYLFGRITLAAMDGRDLLESVELRAKADAGRLPYCPVIGKTKELSQKLDIFKEDMNLVESAISESSDKTLNSPEIQNALAELRRIEAEIAQSPNLDFDVINKPEIIFKIPYDKSGTGKPVEFPLGEWAQKQLAVEDKDTDGVPFIDRGRFRFKDCKERFPSVGCGRGKEYWDILRILLSTKHPLGIVSLEEYENPKGILTRKSDANKEECLSQHLESVDAQGNRVSPRNGKGLYRLTKTILPIVRKPRKPRPASTES